MRSRERVRVSSLGDGVADEGRDADGVHEYSIRYSATGGRSCEVSAGRGARAMCGHTLSTSLFDKSYVWS